MTEIANAGLLPGGVVDEARASLSLHGSGLDPEEITSLLGVDPKESYRRGDRISKWRDEVRTAGHWSVEVAVRAPEDAGSAISQLLAMLPSDPALWADLGGRFRARVSLTLIVKAWNRGFDLPLPIVKELASRGLSVTCQVYAEPQALAAGCS